MLKLTFLFFQITYSLQTLRVSQTIVRPCLKPEKSRRGKIIVHFIYLFIAITMVTACHFIISYSIVPRISMVKATYFNMLVLIINNPDNSLSDNQRHSVSKKSNRCPQTIWIDSSVQRFDNSFLSLGDLYQPFKVVRSSTTPFQLQTPRRVWASCATPSFHLTLGLHLFLVLWNCSRSSFLGPVHPPVRGSLPTAVYRDE